MSNLSDVFLSDFNSLFTLSVGLSFAYVFLNQKKKDIANEGRFFLLFLDKMATDAIEAMAKNKVRHIRELETYSAQIRYYLGTKKLESGTEASFSDVLVILDKIRNSVLNKEEEFKSAVRQRAAAIHLSEISLLLALYGLLVLVIAGIAKKYQENVNAYLLTVDLILFILLSFCLIAECRLPQFVGKSKLNKSLAVFRNIFYPTISKSVIAFVFIMLLGISWIIVLPRYTTLYISFNSILKTEWIVYFTLFMCYSSFLFYSISSACGFIYSRVKFRQCLSKISIKTHVDSFQTIKQLHQKELDLIDQNLKSESFDVNKFDNVP
jgi:hypothetical protein